ncbi:MAG: tetratricopeptide repeat protein [Bryobacteraceae bacterium]|nr:tetratricopeptide repeat protein [Bryobacteraceae bacterium]
MFSRFAVVAMLAGAFLICAPSQAADVERGVSLYNQKDYNGAARELQSAVDADASNPRARYYLALSQIELKRWAEADSNLKQVESAESERPEKADVKVAMARVAMGQNDLGKAQQYLDEARDANSNSAEVYLRRGELALKRKDYQAASKELEQAIQLDPNRAYAHYYLGIAYSNLRRPDKMVEHFEIFRKLAPNAPEVAKVEATLQSVRR